MADPIYLDYNATTPLAPEVVEAMRPYLTEGFGNPSSGHWAGRPAREAVETARGTVAALLGCEPSRIVFTSGGTEANNHAIKGAFFARRTASHPPHVIASRIEHPAVLAPCRFLERLGAEVTLVPVDRTGLVDPDAVRQAIRPGTFLVSIMHANNEVGTIEPIREMAQIAHERGVLFHTDAAQTTGKIPFDVDELGVDLLSVAGHKLYGPKGMGALYVREGVELEPLLHGAGHESGRRASTENVLGIVGLGAACEVARQWIGDSSVRQIRDYFWQRLMEKLGDRIVLNGHPERRLPNTLNVSFRGVRGSEVLARLPQIAASTGSACHTGSEHPSPVLEAMGVPAELALGAVRFSLGRTTTRDEIDAVVEQLKRVLDSS
jgi:cysteine desulfurase